MMDFCWKTHQTFLYWVIASKDKSTYKRMKVPNLISCFLLVSIFLSSLMLGDNKFLDDWKAFIVFISNVRLIFELSTETYFSFESITFSVNKTSFTKEYFDSNRIASLNIYDRSLQLNKNLLSKHKKILNQLIPFLGCCYSWKFRTSRNDPEL